MRPNFSLSIREALKCLSPSILTAIKQMIDIDNIERQLEEIKQNREEVDFEL
jgi:hypothetical protein